MITDNQPIVNWNFTMPSPLTSAGQQTYTLQPMTNGIQHTADGLYLPRGNWLRLPRAACPALNLHGENVQVTVLAWVRRQPQPETYDCETIAGVWDESRKMRQYCLFLDLPIWDSSDQVGAHVSSHGGPTPGHKYCMDAAIGKTPVLFDVWSFVGFTYDGQHVRAYLNAQLDARAGRNPFAYPHGLYDGGPDGADFTVGAVSRSGEPGNFFHGTLRQLAIYDRALTDTQIKHLYEMETVL